MNKRLIQSVLVLVLFPVLMSMPAYALQVSIMPSHTIANNTNVITATMDPGSVPAGGYFFLNVTIPAGYNFALPVAVSTVSNYTMINKTSGAEQVIINIISNNPVAETVDVRFSTDYGATFSTSTNQPISNIVIGTSTLKLTKPTSTNPGFINISLGGTAGPILVNDKVIVKLAKDVLRNPSAPGKYTWSLEAKNNPFSTSDIASAVVTVVLAQKKDVGVYDDKGTWAIANASAPGGANIVGLGLPNAIPMVGDWNGDSLTEIGVYNIKGNNFILRYPDATTTIIGLGFPGAMPVAGDWNGDGKTEVGVYSGLGTWLLANASAPGGVDTIGLGLSNTIPIVGDWNGDGTTKVGVYNIAGNNFILRNTDGTATVIGLGWAGAIPVVGDWNGDGTTKVGLYNGNGTWALWNPTTNSVDFVGFGWNNTIPIVGDWNGDGVTEIGIYNIDGNNFVLRNPDGSATIIGIGFPGAKPVVGKWS